MRKVDSTSRIYGSNSQGRVMSNFQGVRVVMRLMAAAGLSLFVAFGASAQTVRYIHTDALGSPVLVTDKDRNIVERNEYEPYGSLLNRVLTDGPGYTGHIMDAASGFVYMQQRYYDPLLGRFLSVDPVAVYTKKGINFSRYWYASGNPYRFTDPDGRWVCSGGQENCSKFEVALNRAADAAKSDKLAQGQRDTLQKSVDFYGAKGDPNVKVSFADLKGANGNATDKSVVIDIDAAKRGAWMGLSAAENSSNALAKVVVHEGDHGARWKSGEAFGMTRMQLETGGYRAQAFYQQAVGFADYGANQNGWTPLGGINEQTIRGQAALSTITACGSLTGCDGR